MQSLKDQIVKTARAVRESRKRRVAAVASQAVSVAQKRVSQLDFLLTRSAVDLDRVTALVAEDPGFCDLLLSVASMETFNPGQCQLSVHEAVVLFGSERLRILALTCAFMKFGCEELSFEDRLRFWRHSFLTATLSERTARQVEYSEPGQAYLSGLLHDLGRLPLMSVAREEDHAAPGLAANWHDDPAAEQSYFGVDHCEVGRSIASEWNLPPSLVDAIEHHHSPSRAKRESDLVEIVASGDCYSNLLLPDLHAESAAEIPQKTDAVEALLKMCIPPLSASTEEREPGNRKTVWLGNAGTQQFVN